jgi:hypothetical protein
MISAQDILRQHGIAFVATKKSEYTTNCPHCREGYLSVKVDRDGVAWYCHSCKEGGGEKYEKRESAGSSGLGPIKAVYDYTDENGKLLFQALRFEPVGKPKQFRQRTGPDQEKWSIKGARIVPFKLPELIEDLAQERVIFIVEGEKDVTTLRNQGVPATTNPMGAGKWHEEWGKEFFVGADVVICPDNDQPGYAHGLQVARALKPHAKRIRWLDLKTIWADIEQSDDISDWFKAGGSVDSLWAAVEDLVEWHDTNGNAEGKHEFNGQTNGSGTGTGKQSRIRLVAFDDIELGRQRRHLVKGLIPRTGLIVVWGPPKSGKSFWTFDLVMHVALDRPYRGRRVDHGAVVYCAFEGQTGIEARCAAFRKKFLAAEHERVPFYLEPITLDLVKDAPELTLAIRTTLGGVKPVAIVLDTLNRSLRGSESSDEDMTSYVRAADALREAFDCAVIIVHHCGIDGTRPRGHTSLTGAADAQLAVNRDAANNIIVTLEYAKDGPQGDTVASRLEVVDVGIDEDGDPITSCVVLPTEADGMASNTIKVKGAAKVALEALYEAIAECGEVPPASSHIPPKTRTIPVVRWRQYCEAKMIAETDDPDNKRRAFVRLSKKLQELKIIGVWNDLAWIAGQVGQART